MKYSLPVVAVLGFALVRPVLAQVSHDDSLPTSHVVTEASPWFLTASTAAMTWANKTPYKEASYSIGDGCGTCCCNTECLCDCWTRDKLLGDWLGARACLSNHGIIADLQLTQFYQGGTSGGLEQESKYGGKLDYFFIFQGEKLGLWRGLTAVMHAETRFGEDVLDVVGLAPVNVNLLYPSPNNETAITGLQLEQALHDGWSLSAGKINSLARIIHGKLDPFAQLLLERDQ